MFNKIGDEFEKAWSKWETIKSSRTHFLKKQIELLEMNEKYRSERKNLINEFNNRWNTAEEKTEC